MINYVFNDIIIFLLKKKFSRVRGLRIAFARAACTKRSARSSRLHSRVYGSVVACSACFLLVYTLKILSRHTKGLSNSAY